MPEDPTDPETLDEYLEEKGDQDEGRLGERDEVGAGDRATEDLGETPEADAAEQRLELLRLRDTPLTSRTLDDANPADAAEQSRVVDPGDEEYR
ncbi:hypothetical protein [Streptomyces sp. 6N223]|uniref:hypothetical protein n=1 Tax=Streptomyces sp. 6N223 TaxID=3457412 RepID=UPI003FD21A40